jgi:hypothetical protein
VVALEQLVQRAPLDVAGQDRLSHLRREKARLVQRELGLHVPQPLEPDALGALAEAERLGGPRRQRLGLRVQHAGRDRPAEPVDLVVEEAAGRLQEP